MSKSVQQKPARKPLDKINSNNKMKMKAPKKKGVKEADKKVRQSISNGELIKVNSNQSIFYSISSFIYSFQSSKSISVESD